MSERVEAFSDPEPKNDRIGDLSELPTSVRSDATQTESGEVQRTSGGIAGVLRASTSGENISAQGILATIGGVRGICEAVVPAAVFLILFVFTQDPRVSAIGPLAVSVIAVVVRAVSRQPVTPALSGLFGVGICAASTLFSGRGETYFLPGFLTNGIWIFALAVSLVARWPLIGLLLGFMRGSLTAWRKQPLLRRAATLCTWIWLALFTARLGVQLPLYFAAQTSEPGALEALGLARIVMGVPLFALAAVFSWLILSKVSARVPEAADAD